MRKHVREIYVLYVCVCVLLRVCFCLSCCMCSFVYLHVCLDVCLSVCMNICMPVALPVRLFVCLFCLLARMVCTVGWVSVCPQRIDFAVRLCVRERALRV